MAEIRRTGGRPAIDYTARDYDSILAAMRAVIPEELGWTDHTSEADFGNVLLELFASMGDVLSYYQDRVADESFLTTARTRRSVISHLRLIGYELATASPAAAELTVSVPAAHTEDLTINRGDAFATASEQGAASIRYEFNGLEPLSVHLSAITPNAQGLKEFTLQVEEGRLIDTELLGIADGTKNQRFRLLHTPFILRSRGATGQAKQEIDLFTRHGGQSQGWVLRDTLAFSYGPPGDDTEATAQRDFVVEIDEDDQATVVFGDGDLGAIPENGAEVRATYRVGGGAAGNVAARKISTVVLAPDLTRVGATVVNPAPAVGGSDRESIDRAVGHAPAVFRSMRRAVTAADYEALALDFPGVGKVRAEAASWNTVTLHVAPAAGGDLGGVLLAGLRAYFEDKRPLSTIINPVSPSYIPVFVTAQIGVLPYYSSTDVERQVRSAAGALLAFDNVDFALPVYLSRFYEVIEAIDGVMYANISEFRRFDKPADPDDPHVTVEKTGVLQMGPDEIPTPPADEGYDGGLKVIVAEGEF
jgi:hypothetical protein